jgi:hypothetical protein
MGMPVSCVLSKHKKDTFTDTWMASILFVKDISIQRNRVDEDITTSSRRYEQI